LATFVWVAFRLLYPKIRASTENLQGGNMHSNNEKKRNGSTWIAIVALTAILTAGCAGGPLTAREKGAGIGALGGAAVGGIVGKNNGSAGAGAAIGGAVGLGAGALIGDYIQGQQDNEYYRR
jgi:osmotically inducible lipoprotein OsmB